MNRPESRLGGMEGGVDVHLLPGPSASCSGSLMRWLRIMSSATPKGKQRKLEETQRDPVTVAPGQHLSQTAGGVRPQPGAPTQGSRWSKQVVQLKYKLRICRAELKRFLTS